MIFVFGGLLLIWLLIRNLNLGGKQSGAEITKKIKDKLNQVSNDDMISKDVCLDITEQVLRNFRSDLMTSLRNDGCIKNKCL